MHRKGKMIQRSSIDQISQKDQQYLSQNPILAPLLVKHTNELYLWHGNTHQFIQGITSKHHEIGLALRTAILTGSGGFYFSDKAAIANAYSTCVNCNGGGYGILTKPCYCGGGDQLFSMILCRVLLGKIQVYQKFNHEEFNRLTKTPFVSDGQDKPDSLLGVGTDVREIIINDESQIYPEFIIQYRRQKGQAIQGQKTDIGTNVDQNEWNETLQTKGQKNNNLWGSSKQSKPLNLSDKKTKADNNNNDTGYEASVALSDRSEASVLEEKPEDKKKNKVKNFFK